MNASYPERIQVFISYAHKDNEDPDSNKRWLDRLREHLAPLVLQDLVDAWSDQDIEMGDDWHSEIQARLALARVAVLLVSPAFLASTYIRNSELPVLLQKAREQGLVIIPIILRPCLFSEATFKYPDPVTGPEHLSLASLQAGNSPREALSGLDLHRQDQVLLAVAQRILRLVDPNRAKSKIGDINTRPNPIGPPQIPDYEIYTCIQHLIATLIELQNDLKKRKLLNKSDLLPQCIHILSTAKAKTESLTFRKKLDTNGSLNKSLWIDLEKAAEIAEQMNRSEDGEELNLLASQLRSNILDIRQKTRF